MEITIVLFVIPMLCITESVKVLPQQPAWVPKRLGKPPRRPHAGAGFPGPVG